MAYDIASVIGTWKPDNDHDEEKVPGNEERNFNDSARNMRRRVARQRKAYVGDLNTHDDHMLI